LAFLSEESGADGGFLVRLEVVVDEAEDEGGLCNQVLVDVLGCDRRVPTSDIPCRQPPHRAGPA